MTNPSNNVITLHYNRIQLTQIWQWCCMCFMTLSSLHAEVVPNLSQAMTSTLPCCLISNLKTFRIFTLWENVDLDPELYQKKKNTVSFKIQTCTSWDSPSPANYQLGTNIQSWCSWISNFGRQITKMKVPCLHHCNPSLNSS